MQELDALAAVVRTAEARGLSVILIGATARAVVFDQAHDGGPYRATRDVDFGVRVSDWEAYAGLIEALIDNEGFTPIGPHKFRYLDDTEIDLVPFGEIADANGNVEWREGDRSMSVLGFEAASANSEPRELAGVRVDVVNLAGLVILKLYALQDRLHETGAADMQDLDYVLTNSSPALHDRMFDELPPELVEELDYSCLGPYLLAQDVARISDERELGRLISIIDQCVLTAPEYALLARRSVGGDVGLSIACFEAFREGLVAASLTPE